MTVGDRIRKKREIIGMSQTELADRLNIPKQTLYKYEKNIVTNIPSNKIEEIASILNVSESYLMGWEDNLNKNNADLMSDILSNSDLLEHIKKLTCLNNEHRQAIYDSTIYWYKKEGH